MAPIANENDVLTVPASASPAETTGKTQAVALELPVSVNGARTVEGSDKREPFSEATKTVLVFGNGAVIRLTSPVAPGQLLFLTNEKTKKEVVCQVVKSKNYRNVSGYVELEFTEPVVGFWGMRFPSDRIGSQAPSIGASSPSQAPSAAVPPKVPVPTAPKPDAAANFNALKALVSPTSVAADSSPATAPSAPAKQLAPAPSSASSDALKQQTARLQEQLSSMVFAEESKKTVEPSVAPHDQQEAATKVLEFTKPEPVRQPAQTAATVLGAEPYKLTAAPPRPAAPVSGISSKSSLDAEEVKIPSWLEPLARNATTASTTEQPLTREERPKEDPLFSGPLVAESLADTAPPTSEADTKPFGSAFIVGDEPVGGTAAKGSNKGILIGTIAAALLLGAAGVTWYMRNQDGAQRAATRGPAATSAAAQTPAPAATQGLSVAPTPTPATSAASAPVAASVVPSTPITNNATANSGSGSGSVSNAVAKSAQPAPVQPVTPAQVQPQQKKPSLGEVRLAAPKVSGSTAKSLSAEEPGIALSASEPAPSTSLSGIAPSNSKQPVAPAEPLPVGGDVRPAKLVGSVAPVYPQLAKSQHVSGDVKLDALIDATGKVTTMKIVSGPTLLHQAAMDALRQWRYQPATLDGKPVPMHLTVTLQFRLQ